MARIIGLAIAALTVLAAAGRAGETAADAELKRLTERAALSGGREQLWQDLLVFQQKNPGTPQAVKAAALLRELPSPLDRLAKTSIPALERFDWHPKDTVAVLGEHRGRQGGAVTAVQFSRNGKWLASTSTNGYLRLWDPTTMRLVHTLGHSQGAYSVAFSKDNALLASGGGDGQVRLWDIAGDKPKDKGSFKCCSTPLFGLALSPNGKWFASGGSDTRVYLWDLSADPPREHAGSSGHSGVVHSVVYSPDGKTIASGGADKMIRLWSLNAMNQMKEKSSIEAHAPAVQCLAYHPTDDKTLISGGADGMIRVWSTTPKLTPRTTLKGKSGAVLALAFSASGKTVAASYADGNVRTFAYLSNGTLTEKAVGEGHRGGVTGVSFSPDGQNLATGGQDWTVRLWPAVSGPRPKDKTIGIGHWSHAYNVVFAPDATSLASGSYDTTVRLWDLAAAEPKERSTLKHESFVYTVAYSPDGKQVAAGGGGVKIRTFDVASGQFKTLSGHTGNVSRLAYSSDGRYLASCSQDKTIRIWNGKSGEGESTITNFETYVNCVAFSPDNKQIACASGYYLYDKNNQIVSKDGFTLFNDSTIRLYEVGSFKESFRWKYEKALMGFVTFAPDSRTLYAGASDVHLRQWDAVKPAKEPETFYKGSAPGVSFITCSPDGRWLATYGPDYRINLIDRATGKKAREIVLGEQYGNLAFAPDSRHLAISVGTGVALIVRLEEAKK